MRPRVLIVTTYYHPVLGGVETHARQIAGHLHASGFGVEILTKRVGVADAIDAEIDGVPVHRVGPAGERSASGKWLAAPAFFRAILARKSRVDAIVCVDYRGIGVAAIAAARILGRPVIVQGETAGVLAGAAANSTSGIAPESLAARLLKMPARAIYRRADHLVCIGRDLEREALRAGMPRDRVHYLPPGVDLTRFHPPVPGERARLRATMGWPLDKTIVLFAGRLSVEKGAQDLIEAWSLVDRRGSILVLVGPDMTGHPWDVGASGRAYVAEHDLGDRVRFEGPTSDTAPFYRAADVFVQPSHFEAFGSSAVEAMASGLPIVSSGVGGLGDFLVAGDNALLHDARSPQSIARVLTQMLHDQNLRERLAARSLETAQRFELRGLLDRFAQLVESTVGRS
jgi:phosphatidylinositol alpha-mannosyltransferase/D-inositol-3-phosphate glycosyltransferase